LRIQWFALAFFALVFGAIGGAILAPQPAGAVNKDMIELQQTVSQIQTNQQDMRSAMDANNATIKTLVQQSIDSVNQMSTQMGSLQKSVQEVQANTGSRIDSMTQQTQGISDNLSDVQARVQKLSQQLSDMQGLMQSIDAKVSSGAPGTSMSPGGTPSSTTPGGPAGSYPPSYPANSAPGGAGSPSTYNTAPATGGGAPYGGAGPTYPAGGSSSANGAPPYAGAPPSGRGSAVPASMPSISSGTLYQNALRDLTSGNYDLSRQEFSDYISHFPSSDLAPNAQYYLGEIYYAQGDYKSAITDYDVVLTKYPESLNLSSALLKKAQAELALKERTSATRDLRAVVSRFPGSDDARRAKSLLQSMGVPATAPRTTTH
jgi:tol-pal system protein YbgF